jgi:hypothetical protein
MGTQATLGTSSLDLNLDHNLDLPSHTFRSKLAIILSPLDLNVDVKRSVTELGHKISNLES